MPLSKQQQARLAQFVRLSNRPGSRPDYVQGCGGSTSAKLGGGIMAVKAGGFLLKNIEDDQGYVLVDWVPVREFLCRNRLADLPDSEVEMAEKLRFHCMPDAGGERPQLSAETGFHVLLGRFVLHSHSVYARILSCMDGAERLCTQWFEKQDFLFYLIPAVKPGTGLNFAIREVLDGCGCESLQTPLAFLLKDHGLVVSAANERSCWFLHERVNRLCAAALGLSTESYPEICLTRFDSGDGCRNCYRSSTAWLAERLAEGKYGNDFFRGFAQNFPELTFSDDARTAEEKGGVFIAQGGTPEYYMGHARARGIEETLLSQIFIAEQSAVRGLPPAKPFLRGMLSD